MRAKRDAVALRRANDRRLRQRLERHRPLVAPPFSGTRESLAPNDAWHLQTNTELQFEFLMFGVPHNDILASLPKSFIARYVLSRFWMFDNFVRYRSTLAEQHLAPLAAQRWTQAEIARRANLTRAFANVELLVRHAMSCAGVRVRSWKKWYFVGSDGLKYRMAHTAHTDRFVFGPFVVHDFAPRLAALQLVLPLALAMQTVRYGHTFCTTRCACQVL